MQRKIYYLDTCQTCQRVIKEMGGGEDFEFQNIKQDKITPEQLDFLKEKIGSYEALFSKRAMKYRSMGLNTRVLTEEDYRQLMLEEYTFLKRPIVIIGENIFIGSAKKNIEAIKVKVL